MNIFNAVWILSKENNLLKYIEKAELYLSCGKYKESMKFFNKSLEIIESESSIDPFKYAILYIKRAWLEENIEDYVGAIKDIEKAASIYPKLENYYLELAIFKTRIQDYKGAIELLDSFTKNVLLSRDVKFKCLSKLIDNQVFVGDGSFTLDKTHAVLHNNLVSILFDKPSDIFFKERKMDLYQDYDQSLHFIAHLLNADLKIITNDKEGAISNYEQAISTLWYWDKYCTINEHQLKYIASARLFTLTKLAQLEFQMGKYQNAILTYNKIIDQYSIIECKNTLFNRGIAKLAIANFKSALVDFMKVNEIDPNYPNIQIRISEAKTKISNKKSK